MQIIEVMRKNPNCCVPATTVRAAAGMLRHFDIGILLVIDDVRSHKLLGVVTDRDLCLRALAEECDPAIITVQQCMTRDAACCTPEQDVRQVLALMAKRQVRRIPVVDNERRVAGLVTLADLLQQDAATPRDLCAALTRITTPSVRGSARAASVGAWP